MKTHNKWFYAILLIIGLATTQKSFAQMPDLNEISPDRIFDTVFDKDGAKYHLSELEIARYYNPYSGKSVATTCNAGFFTLYFETGSLGGGTVPQQAANQAVICRAFEDIANSISSPLTAGGNTITVNILIKNDQAMSTGNLGYATQFYTMPAGVTSIGGLVDGEVYKTIITGKDGYTNYAPILYNVGLAATAPNGGYFHGMAAFNFYTMNPSYSWNTTMGTTSLTAFQYDLYSVALHEAIHALGFASLINSNGLSKLAPGFNYFARYDKFLKDYNNISLLKQTGSTCGGNYNYAFNSPATSTTVLQATTCATSVIFAGTANQKAFTPAAFSTGSSLSHFDDACHSPTFTAGTGNVMHPGIAAGNTRRYYQPEERNALCDIGYAMKTSFGSTVAVNTTTYAGGVCPGIDIGGVNDGFNAGGYIWTAPQNTAVAIPIASILANDYNATQVSCPELVYGLGAVSVSGSNLVFTPTSTYTGPFVIRYVPYNGTNYGNITYVFGFIVPGACNPVSACDIVQNGGFESITGTYQCGDKYSGSNINLNCWFSHVLTPDLFGTGCTNNASSSTAFNNGAYNLGTNTFSSSPVWTAPPTGTLSNNHVLGFIDGKSGYYYAESMQNHLSSPLINGQAYQISFWCYNYSGIIKFPYNTSTETYTVNPSAHSNVLSFCTSSLTTLSPQTGTYWSSTASSLTPVYSYTTSSVNTWVNVTATFTYSGSNGNVLVLGGDVNKNITLGSTPSGTTTGSWHYMLIDELSILPVNVAAVLSIPQTTYCPSSPTVTNLAQYATPVDPSSSFSGPGVSFSGGQYHFNPSIAGSGTHAISYTYVDGLGCSHTAYQQLTVKPTFSITPSSQIIYAGQSATMTATGSTGTYSWNPGALTGSVVVVTPSVTTVYTVTNAMSGTCTVATPTVIVSTACQDHNTASYGTSSTSTVTIPAGTYTATGQIWDLQGTITFTGNTSFTGYTMRMAPGTQLYVASNATLTLGNCKLFGCTELWYGITLFTGDGNNGNIELRSGTTIEDMYWGIHRDIPWATGSNVAQGFIRINDSKLNKNYYGVQLLCVKSPSNSGVSYDLTVKNSTITTVSSLTSPGHNLKPGTASGYTYAYKQIPGGAGGATASYTNFPRGYTGINLFRLSPLNNVVIGDSAGSANTYNTFSNLDIGICATNAQLRVHNNYFYNLKGSPKYAYFDPFDPVTVDGPEEIGVCVVAQHTVANTYSLVVGTNNTTPVTISMPYRKSNSFKTINKGVSAKNCSLVIAKGNYFDGDTTDVPSTDFTLPGPSSNTYSYLKAQSAIWATGLGKGGTMNHNFVKNYRYGINASITLSVTSGSYLTIKSNNIQVPATVTGYCRNAINLEQVGGSNMPANALEVHLNAITKVYSGIFAKSILAGLYVHDNTNISLEDYTKTLGKGLTPSAYGNYGIYLQSVSNGRVEKNSVYATGTITATNYSVMNAYYMITSATNTITCNSANNVGRGYYFQGNCASPNGWMGNAVSNSYNGLELKTSGVMGIQGAASSTLAANTWSNVTQETYVTGTTNANTASYMFVAANSTYTTAPSLNFGTATQTYSIGALQGIRITAGTPFDCGGGGCGGCRTSSSGDSSLIAASEALYAEMATATDSVFPEYADEMMYQNQQLVYRLQDQGLLTTTDNAQLQDFYSTNQNSNIAKFTDVQTAIANNDVSQALSTNSSIATTNAVEQKTQRANELMLKWNMDCNYSFSPIELQDLITMAHECPVKGWYVAQSRSIINAFSGTLVEYTDECEDSEQNNRQASAIPVTEPQRSFNLFPNPNNGSMILSYDLCKDKKAKLNLYDVTGKLISSYKLENTKGTLEINEANLHNGIYFYRILVNGNLIHTNKVVIIK